MTPFGIPVEPEVKRIFATVSGSTLEMLALEDRAGVGFEEPATGVDFAPTASSAGANFCGSAANTSPGFTSSKMDLSPKSLDSSEYAGETGATGTPTCIAPSASSAWSMLLSERIATGRSAFSPRSSSASPMRRAAPYASR